MRERTEALAGRAIGVSSEPGGRSAVEVCIPLADRPLFTEPRRRGILRTSRLACGGGIMIVVERVGLLLESGSERRTLYVCGTEQGGLPAHP